MFKGTLWLALIIILATLIMAAAAPLISNHPPDQISLSERLMPPVFFNGNIAGHPLGTDQLGRDLLARMAYGARISLLVAAFGVIFGGGIGLCLGVVAGYVGGRVDTLIMRAVDVCLSFPIILFAFPLAIVKGPGIDTVIIAVTIGLWSRFARVIRGEVLALRDLDYINAARVQNCSDLRIMIVHILPNVLNTFVVLMSLNIGWVIVAEASLSFLGAGIPLPTSTWGSMASDGKDFITSAWWISLLPGLGITLLVLALNLFGDWLRDFLDPKLRQV